ncbi:MAG: dehydrogenase, partial [Thermoproteota archaeon]|nr:dehydrogenase [Thermoproteota archaeon]
DIEKITNGEHPVFSTVDKIGMLIRGTLNKKLAEDLKYTANMNEILVNHYRNYPESPDGFVNWSNILNKHLTEAFARFV